MNMIGLIFSRNFRENSRWWEVETLRTRPPRNDYMILTLCRSQHTLGRFACNFYSVQKLAPHFLRGSLFRCDVMERTSPTASLLSTRLILFFRVQRQPRQDQKKDEWTIPMYNLPLTNHLIGQTLDYNQAIDTSKLENKDLWLVSRNSSVLNCVAIGIFRLLVFQFASVFFVFQLYSGFECSPILLRKSTMWPSCCRLYQFSDVQSQELN